MAVTVGLVCDIGIGVDRGGRARNEDAYLVCQSNRVRLCGENGARTAPQQGEGALVAVCDGMGGHEDGHIASATAARVMSRLYQPGAPKRPAQVLLHYILDAHRQLYAAALQEGPVSMGTTLTAVWLINGTAAWAHVGDSRLYLFRSDRLIQLTPDQTRNEFARRDGQPTVPEGEQLAQNFIYGSRGLGDNTTLRLEQGLDSGAEVMHRGDLLLLCTDGLTCAVPDEQIRTALATHRDPQEAADVLLKQALRMGSRDNVTVAVIRIEEVSAGPAGP